MSDILFKFEKIWTRLHPFSLDPILFGQALRYAEDIIYPLWRRIVVCLQGEQAAADWNIAAVVQRRRRTKDKPKHKTGWDYLFFPRTLTIRCYHLPIPVKVNKMKAKIPKIPFFKKSRAKLEFEIFTIRSLFSRRDKLDFLLDMPHRVTFYHIMFITRGKGRHYIDFQPYEYSAGSMLFISQGQVHAFEVRKEVDGFLILFTDAFLSKNLLHADMLSFYRLYNYHLHTPIMQPAETSADIFSDIINEIYREYKIAEYFAKEEILCLLLKLLLLKAERLKRTLIGGERTSKWFLKFGLFRNALEKHFTETRNAKEYARMMNISYKHLNEICKSVTGGTAKVFIDHFVVLEMKRRLAILDASVKELTYQLGFDEPTNFVKFFKKHTRQSPSQFRKSLKP